MGHLQNPKKDLQELNRLFGQNWQQLTAKEIKQQFKRKALELHPDKNPNGEAEFKLLNKWYDVLSNTTTKSELISEINQFQQPPRQTKYYPSQQESRTQDNFTDFKPRTVDPEFMRNIHNEFAKQQRGRQTFVRKHRMDLNAAAAQQKKEIDYGEINHSINRINTELELKRGKNLSLDEKKNLLQRITSIEQNIRDMLSTDYRYKKFLTLLEEQQLKMWLETTTKEFKSKIESLAAPKRTSTTQYSYNNQQLQHLMNDLLAEDSTIPTTTQQKSENRDAPRKTESAEYWAEELVNDFLSSEEPESTTPPKNVRKLDRKPPPLTDIQTELAEEDSILQQNLQRNNPTNLAGIGSLFEEFLPQTPPSQDSSKERDKKSLPPIDIEHAKRILANVQNMLRKIKELDSKETRSSARTTMSPRKK